MIVEANGEPAVVLRDVSDGQEVAKLHGQAGGIFKVAVSQDGRWIAGGGEGTVELWDARTRQQVRTLRGHTGLVFTLAFSPDGLFLASGTSTRIEATERPRVKIWELLTGKEIATYEQDHWGHQSVVFSPDSRHLAQVGGWWPGIRILDPLTGRETRALAAPTARGGLRAAYSPNGKQIAMADLDGTLTLWDVTQGAIVRVFRGHSGMVNHVSFSPDGRQLASASSDGTIKLWEVENGREIASFRGHRGPVSCVLFSPDGSLLASTSMDKTLKFWNVATWGDAYTLEGYRGWAFGAVFSPDGRRIITAGFGLVRVSDAQNGQTLTTISVRGGGVRGLALSPDGKVIATSTEFRKDFDLWDVATGQHISTFHGHTGLVRNVAFTPDGRELASAGEDGTVRMWDVATGRNIRTLHGHAAGVFGVACSPDGCLLASLGWDGRVKIWEITTGHEIRTLDGLSQRPSFFFGNSIAFGPDGLRLAVADDDGQVIVWNISDGTKALTLAGHPGDINGVAYSPDGRRIATAGQDGILKLWDAETGEEVFTLRGHGEGVVSVVFSPDGARIASAGEDRTVRIWDAMQPTPEIQLQRRALNLVQTHLGQLLLKDEVVAHIRAETAMAEPLREAALQVAARAIEDAGALNNAAWEIAVSKNQAREKYDRALRYAQAACRQAPDDPICLNTLGVAQYRAGKYQEAIVTLTKSDRLNPTPQAPYPGDLAFLAMAQHRLGQKAVAVASLNQLRTLMKLPKWAQDRESRSFFSEVEALIDPSHATTPESK
jgi:WD40 repeat protein